jgi:hypothetical protein
MLARMRTGKRLTWRRFRTPAAEEATTQVAQKKDGMKRREGMRSPVEMYRGAAVGHGNTAYFTLNDNQYNSSHSVYSYRCVSGEEEWTRLPDNPFEGFCLAVIDGLVTSVGGLKSGPTNTLLSLTGEDVNGWSQIFHPMPTPRSHSACAMHEKALIVAGGRGTRSNGLNTVEVMNSDTKRWTPVAPLPEKCWSLTTAVCGDILYVGGGCGDNTSVYSVFSCPLPELLASSNTLGSRVQRALLSSRKLWRQVSSLPVTDSTLVSFRGDLLAVGGVDHSAHNSTADVYRYDPHTDSWTVATQTKNKRSYCFAVNLTDDHLVVVGGITEYLRLRKTSEVEIFE